MTVAAVRCVVLIGYIDRWNVSALALLCHLRWTVSRCESVANSKAAGLQERPRVGIDRMEAHTPQDHRSRRRQPGSRLGEFVTDARLDSCQALGLPLRIVIAVNNQIGGHFEDDTRLPRLEVHSDLREGGGTAGLPRVDGTDTPDRVRRERSSD